MDLPDQPTADEDNIAQGARAFGISPEQYAKIQALAAQQGTGVNWQQAMKGKNPALIRALIAQTSRNQGYANGLGDERASYAAGDLAEHAADREHGLDVDYDTNEAAQRGEVSAAAKAEHAEQQRVAQRWNTANPGKPAQDAGDAPAPDTLVNRFKRGALYPLEAGNALRKDPGWGTAAQAGMATAALGSYGFNPMGLARLGLSNTAMRPDTTTIDVARPGQPIAAPNDAQTRMSDLANRYGVQVGAYTNPQLMVDAMRKSIAAKAPDTPEGKQWAQDETSRLNAVLDSEGGVQGMQGKQNAATAGLVAGNGGARRGTVNEAYDSTIAPNMVLPTDLARSQVDMMRGGGAAVRDRLKQVGDAVTGKPIRGMPAKPGMGWLGRLGAGAGLFASAPSYLTAAKNDMNLYDTATDPNAEGGAGHTAMKWGTGLASGLGQAFAGEYQTPLAMVNGANAGAAAMQGTKLGTQLSARALLAQRAAAASQFAQESLANVPRSPSLFGRGVQGAKNWLQAGKGLAGNALQSVKNMGGLTPLAQSVGRLGWRAALPGAVKGAAGFVRGAAGGLLGGSVVADAAANSSAMTRNLAGDYWGGGDETVREENRQMADNQGWNKADAGAMDYLKGGIGGVLRPATTTREIAGVVDQNREAIRGNEDTAAEQASQQHIAPLMRLQKYRQQLAAAKQDTSAVDKQIQTTAQQINAGPSNQSWQDVAKWQKGGWFSDRGQQPYAEQYANMDAETRAQHDAIVKGVAEGTVDPERARVALGMPAVANWGNDDARNPAKTGMNQSWVLEQANAAREAREPYRARTGADAYKATGQWQNPNAAIQSLKPQPAAAPAPTANTPVAPAAAAPRPTTPAPAPVQRPAVPEVKGGINASMHF